jgi:glycosyltransferase involved in cell wall biosynthesis
MVVLPLPDGWASWGQMTLLQAMALGKPVVVTDVRPVRDYIAEGCVTVPPNDVHGLVEAASALWLDNSLRSRVGHAASQVVTEKFNERIMARRFEGIVLSALGSRTAPAGGQFADKHQ